MIFSSNLFKFRNDFVELSTTWKVLREAKVLFGDEEIFLKIHRIKIETFVVPFDCWFLFYLAAVLSKRGQRWEKLDKSCSTMLNTLESIFELKAVWVRERYGIRDERPVKFTLSNICLTFYKNYRVVRRKIYWHDTIWYKPISFYHFWSLNESLEI